MDKGNDKYQEEYKEAINVLEDSIKKIMKTKQSK